MSGTILIVDAVPTSSIVLRVKLSSAFYNVRQELTGESALASLAWNCPDVLVVSSELPDLDALTFCKRLRALPQGRDVRLILRHAEQNAPHRLDWLAAGADEVLTGPLDEQLFLARVRALLRQQAAEAELSLEFEQPPAAGFCEPASPFHRPARIALVSGGGDIALGRLQEELGARLDDHVEVLVPEAALTAASGAADVYVITEDPGRATIAEALLSQLHANRATRHSSLIYIAGPSRSAAAARALDLGACEVISGEPELDELAVRLRRQVARKRRRDRLRAGMRDSLRAAITDSLTDLNNRRFALSHLSRRIGGGVTSPYALFLADLDGFKQVNDTHGHAAGDALLAEVGERFRRKLCDADLLARIGGDEFVFGYSVPDEGMARELAERARDMVGGAPFSLPGLPRIRIGVSVGAAIAGPRDGLSPEKLLERADRALYSAKKSGRNTACVYDDAQQRFFDQDPYEPAQVEPLRRAVTS
ncbi:diguanylate cyclase domain-containing protein [Allosediminivita pacifica]|uniref:diguanylate cyclase n=1 Tax=Allosediminivita pacifica TaxID=1267769 RepID=A0A2T6ABK3_9RHOB|nr:diguanylate cyclase [Allosediminivita pacifica]PTX41203.1 response regulator receiver modulated diguanylate cyclase [Allosediminivita pacifica]GGB24459.1 diguanylate cyclase response regulator [Allosediminivita pacifica]